MTNKSEKEIKVETLDDAAGEVRALAKKYSSPEKKDAIYDAYALLIGLRNMERDK
ncbi:hypothetical protein [Vibrio parahaemolyticus]|uniref:hypothetical protein n=1 Tax=Vibrio parahaemolyticus TaxID=670 RepID=UPI002361A4E9|nr:hypothetical protein [Vibrio parahaemolyticus]